MAIDPNKKIRGFAPSNYIRWGIVFGITIVFLIILYPGLVIKKHTYRLGDVAETNIKAPKDFFIEDKEETRSKRRQAIDAVLTVYDHDTRLTAKLVHRISQSFLIVRSVYNAHEAEANKPDVDVESPDIQEPVLDPKPTVDDQVTLLKNDFEKVLGIPITEGQYSRLMKEKFSNSISQSLVAIVKEIQNNGVVANKEILLKEADKGITLRSLQTKTERGVQSLRALYGLDQAKAMVRIVGDPLLKTFDRALRDLTVEIAQGLILPNITLNRSETEERKKLAEEEIKPILYQIKAGEMILREGERVTPLHLKKLEAMQSLVNEDMAMASGLGAALILICLLVSVYLVYVNQQNTVGQDHYKDLLLIACILVTIFLISKLSLSFSAALAQSTYPNAAQTVYFGVPVAVGAMIICLFIGIEVAIAFSLLMCVCVAILFHNRFDLFIYFYLNSTLAAYWIQNCRARKTFVQAGMKLGLINVLIATAICLYGQEFSVMRMLWAWGFALVGGIQVGIITLGLAPLIEISFGYTTDITLLERANLDQPILRQLMIEAPGTYHHSVIVGSLVEAAATEINANPLVAKACGYYHDIGKIKKPLYFIENQRNGKNRHDKLAPSMSSLILISHIKHGVEIAKANKLGPQIVDTIQQHHGTSLIKYFFDKAKHQRGEDAVKIDDFRYPGPKPQTREAGLVMLADVVEAASRTLDNPTPARIQGLVQNLINKVFSDGQLDNCELTLKDLHNIAKSFNNILNGIYHHRIEYSESPAIGNGKSKHESTDRQPARQDRNTTGEDKANSTSHLKRLGLS